MGSCCVYPVPCSEFAQLGQTLLRIFVNASGRVFNVTAGHAAAETNKNCTPSFSEIEKAVLKRFQSPHYSIRQTIPGNETKGQIWQLQN